MSEHLGVNIPEDTSVKTPPSLPWRLASQLLPSIAGGPMVASSIAAWNGTRLGMGLSSIFGIFITGIIGLLVMIYLAYTIVQRFHSPPAAAIRNAAAIAGFICFVLFQNWQKTADRKHTQQGGGYASLLWPGLGITIGFGFIQNIVVAIILGIFGVSVFKLSSPEQDKLQALIQQNNYQEAENLLKSLPESANNIALRGYIRLLEKDYVGSLQLARMVLTIDPNNPCGLALQNMPSIIQMSRDLEILAKYNPDLKKYYADIPSNAVVCTDLLKFKTKLKTQ